MAGMPVGPCVGSLVDDPSWAWHSSSLKTCQIFQWIPQSQLTVFQHLSHSQLRYQTLWRRDKPSFLVLFYPNKFLGGWYTANNWNGTWNRRQLHWVLRDELTRWTQWRGAHQMEGATSAKVHGTPESGAFRELPSPHSAGAQVGKKMRLKQTNNRKSYVLWFHLG